MAAVGVGLSDRDAAIFMGIFTAAGALAQWPVGRTSDRVDRRLVLIAILLAAAVVGLLLAFLPANGTLWLILAAFLGAAMAPTLFGSGRARLRSRRARRHGGDRRRAVCGERVRLGRRPADRPRW